MFTSLCLFVLLNTFSLKATILKKTEIKDLPSASGIEVVDGIIYVIGDDSPYLYCLDHHLNVLERVLLYETSGFEEGRIPKNVKADLECLTLLTIDRYKYLFISGSGATEQRNRAFLVKLPTKYNKKHVVREVLIANLFDFLRSNPDICSSGRLNLEGAAVSENKFILLQRANQSSGNIALVFDKEEFIVFLMENSELIPFPEILPVGLPLMGSLKSGFSGACVFDDLFFYTASVEETQDAVQDGKVYGSFIGLLHMNSADYTKGVKKDTLSSADSYSPVLYEHTAYPAKVESICVYAKESENQYIALAVTDDDKGGSELLMIEIKM
jgi:hypothetical protein